MRLDADISLTPEQVADAFWQMSDYQQAEMMKHLYHKAEGNHFLMMQGMALRDACIKRGDESLEAFQTLFASAFMYASQRLWP